MEEVGEEEDLRRRYINTFGLDVDDLLDSYNITRRT